MDIAHITPKQFEILILLYRFRFLNRIQIQTYLHHKDPRRIKTWLKNLTDKKIIGRHYSTKFNENTKPAIYYLMTKSKVYLLGKHDVNEGLLKRVYREKIRSQRIIDHSIFLADFHLNLIKYAEGEEIHFFTKTDLSTYYYLPFYRPDAYIAREKSKTIKRYFLEIVDEGTPRYALRKRIEQYIEYYDAKTWQDRTGHPFPKILFLCPNSNIKDFLHKYLARIMEEEVQAEIDFYVSSREKIEWVNALEYTETAPL